MNQIYVVMECIGGYEGNDSNPILVTPDIKKAEDKIVEMVGRLEARNKIYESIRNHMADWEINNPHPGKVLKSKSKGSPRTLDDEFKNWADIRYNELTAFTSTFAETEQEDYKNLDKDMYWEIEIVPYLE